MRFASFQYQDQSGWGAIEGSSILDLSTRAVSLKAAIAAGSLQPGMDLHDSAAKRLDLAAVTLLCPIPDPQRILCVGQNYAAHRDEMAGAVTTKPLLFTRFPLSLVAHQAPLLRPRESRQFDYEGELALVIGKAGRRIRAERALEHVAGYSCFMDGTLRDFQNHTTQYLPGKNFDRSGAFGPWLVSADEIPDPNAGLSLCTRLNGELVQQTRTDLMIFDIPTIIAYVSTFTTLEPGDVIATGTPGGVGYKREPQLFMKPGDRIEVEIEAVATLSNPISED